MIRAAAVVLALVMAPAASDAHCGCRHPQVPRCAAPDALHRVTVRVDLTVVDGTVEVITQSGPFNVPVAELDGKTVLLLFMPRGDVFQGFLEEAVPGSITVGTMHGATASITTGAVFAPAEYELLLFVDVAPGGGIGPQRGDLAAFDNTVCDPTGVSVRVPVGCDDTTVTLVNRHFILF